MQPKTLNNTSMELKNESKTEIHGNPSRWVCVSKAWNKDENWMKSTKVMQVGHRGCLVQITTQQCDNVAEAICFAPGVELKDFQ